MFAVAMSLVLFISTVLLLHQFLTGALLDRENGETAPRPFPRRPARLPRLEGRPMPPPPAHRVDHAA